MRTNLLRGSLWLMTAGVLLAVIVGPARIVSLARGNTMIAPKDAAGMDCNALGCKLYQKLTVTEKGNIFISPYSLESALVMTFLGADGQTALQMRQTLCLPRLKGIDPEPAVPQPQPGQNGGAVMMGGGGDRPLPMGYVTDGFKQLTQDIGGAGGNKKPGIELTTVNALWGDKTANFQKAYLDQVHDVFAGDLKPLDFRGDAEGSRKAINDAVAQQTKDKIKDLMPAGAVDANTRLVLTNAVYFKAAWQHPFEKARTKDDLFNLYTDPPADPNELRGPNPGNLMVIQVPFMVQTETVKYGRTAEAQVVELNYQGGDMPGDVRMVIIMPHDEAKLTALEKGLDPAKLWQEESAAKNVRIELHMPKFKFATPSYDIGAALKSLGMTDAFDPSKADLSKITGSHELFISGVFHKAFVDVNEEGTEAAAATGVGVAAMAMPAGQPQVVKIDRPFLFYIQKGVTILFMGRVTMPEK